MGEISATEAARRFSELLDEVEHRGESFMVTRHGKPVAQVGPVDRRSRGGELLEFVRSHSPDSDWVGELRELREAFPAEADRWPA